MNMEEYKLQIIESVITLIILIFSLKISQRVINKAGIQFSYQVARIKIVQKVTNFVLNLLALGILLLIWGIAPSQLLTHIATMFTVVGIAFLAQWSIVSNITATLIIFFNHHVKIGDTIKILDKDYEIEGVISDIGAFFIIIKVDGDEYVSLPSNVFMQKMVKKVNVDIPIEETQETLEKTEQ